MSRKLYIKTFGCQMNEYDSSRIADVLTESHDLELTANPEDADVLLLNTCSIRESPPTVNWAGISGENDA